MPGIKTREKTHTYSDSDYVDKFIFIKIILKLFLERFYTCKSAVFLKTSAKAIKNSNCPLSITYTLGSNLYISEGTAQPGSFAAPIYGAVSSIIFHDATIYFTIICGLQFSYLLKERGYQSFYLSKLKYVFLPYICASLFFTLLSMVGPPSLPLALYQ